MCFIPRDYFIMIEMEEKMKIAILTPGFLPVPAINGGAIESLITNLIDLNEIEHEFYIDIFTCDYSQSFSYQYTSIIKIKLTMFQKNLEKVINKIYKVFHFNKYFSFFNKKVLRLIEHNEYDYIIIENNMFLYDCVLSCDDVKKKLIFHLHNDFLGPDKPLYLCKEIASTAQAVITVSDFLKMKFEQYTGMTNIYTLPNCINLKNFKNVTIKANDGKKIIFLYVGRFSKEKGLLELILAFNKLSDVNKNCYLYVVGDNNSKDKYSLKIKKIASKNANIVFKGFVPNSRIADIYSECDVVVVPSICNEAFGLTVLEALAAKKPVVASNRGGIPEILSDKYGILVDNDNFIENLFKAMYYMIDTNHRKKFVENILKFDFSLYLYSNYLQNLKEIILCLNK